MDSFDASYEACQSRLRFSMTCRSLVRPLAYPLELRIIEAAVVLHETLVATDNPRPLPNTNDIGRRLKDSTAFTAEVIQLVPLRAWAHLLCDP